MADRYRPISTMGVKLSGPAIVTGAGGFIGTHMVRFLQEADIEVIGVDKSQDSRGFETVHEILDLGREDALLPFLSPNSVVFHLAGRADVRGSVRDPKADFQANVLPTFNVLESVRKRRARFLFASTASVYDQAAGIPFTETDPTKPVSPYAAAKLAGEAYCLTFSHCYDLFGSIVRLGSVYGPGMRHLAIYDFYRKVRQNPDRIEIWGSGEQVRDYIYIKDAVEGMVSVASQQEPEGVFNLASGTGRRILDVAKEVAHAMGFPECDVVPDGSSCSAEATALELDIARLRSIGFEPTMGFREGVEETIKSFEQSGFEPGSEKP